MQHRTNEAMNGLSNRLDKLVRQAETNSRAQGKQLAVMIALTTVLAIATVAYTVTTIYATRATVGAHGASASSRRLGTVAALALYPRAPLYIWERTRKECLLFASMERRTTFPPQRREATASACAS